MKKKALILSLTPLWTPHFETELEIISDLQDENYDIDIVTCCCTLKSCIANPKNDLRRCKICLAKFYNGMKAIGLSYRDVIKLKNKSKYFQYIPEKINSIDELINFEINGIDIGRAVASNIITRTKDHQFDVKVYQELIIKTLISSVIIYDNLKTYLDHNKPDKVLFFNGRFAEYRPLVRLCEQRKIKFFTHERGADCNKYELFEDCLPHSLENMKNSIEKYWKTSNYSEKQKIIIAKRWFINRRKGIEQGWVSYVKDHKKGSLPSNFNQSKRNIVVFTSSINEKETFPEWQNPLFKNELEALEFILDKYKTNSNFHFYVRIHPNLKNLNNTQLRKLKEFSNIYTQNATFIDANEFIDSYNLIDVCEKVITFMSTMGVEACYWKKPSILCGRAIYEDLNCHYSVNSKEDLIHLINIQLEAKPRENTYKYSFWEATRGIPYRKYMPYSLYRGKFLGKKITSGMKIQIPEIKL
jgi:hypothetical protein